MKYLIVFLIILLQPNVIFGFTAYTFVKESDFEKNKETVKAKVKQLTDQYPLYE